MTEREKGLLPISANFEPATAQPFDARMRTPLKSNLTDTDTFDVFAFRGMIVVVYDDTEENNGAYILKDLPYTNENNWQKVGTGGVGSVAWNDITGNQSDVNVGGFTNDAGYITASSTDTLTNKSGNISMWTNDSGYITGNQTITLSGDVTGSGTTAITTTLATVGVAKGGTGQTSLTANKVMVGNGTSGVLTPTDLHWDNINKRLGIDIVSPIASLHVNDTIIAGSTTGAGFTASISLGTRFLWYGRKGAIQAGNHASIDANIGLYSANFGNQNTVSAESAFSMGSANTVSADYGAAFGDQNNISGISSFTIGDSNAVSGLSSGAFGGSHDNSGDLAYVFGQTVTNSGNNSFIFNTSTSSVSNEQNNVFKIISGFSNSPQFRFGSDGGSIVSTTFRTLFLQNDNNNTSNWMIQTFAQDNLRFGVYSNGLVHAANGIEANSGSVALPSYGFIGNSGTGMYRITTNTLGFATYSTERMRLDSSGNVGIGTNSPGRKLHVSGTTDSGFTVERTSGETSAFVIIPERKTVSLYSRATNASKISRAIRLIIGNTERVRVDTGGNVGIGTNYPGRKLHVSGTTDSGFAVERTTDTTSAFVIIPERKAVSLYSRATNASKTSRAIRLIIGNTERVRVDTGGNVGIGVNSPNRKLYVSKTVAGLDFTMKLDNPSGETTGRGPGILFNTGTGGVARGKGALVYVYPSSPSWNRGDFHFLQNTGANSINPTLADSVMVIKNNGNVGIGTTSPSSNLEVRQDNSGGIGGEISITNSTSTHNSLARLVFRKNPGPSSQTETGIIQASHTSSSGGRSYMEFFTRAQSSSSMTRMMRIHEGDRIWLLPDSTGRVGIRTTSPSTELHVNGGIRGQFISSDNSAGITNQINFYDYDSVYHQVTIKNGIITAWSRS